MTQPFDINAITATVTEDMTVDAVFERELPREGVALARLLSYVETGRHAPKNPAHKPSLRCILTFELLHPDHMYEVEGKGKQPMTIQVRLSKGSTAKSGFKKMFNALNHAHGNEFTHISQMIGKAWLCEVFHNVVGEGDKKQTYANLDKDGAWSFKEPAQVDALANTKTPIQVPELHGTPTLFLWEPKEMPEEHITAMWDSIFIDGMYEAEGDKPAKSKNWMQELIMTNLEWEGSKTQELTQDSINLDALDSGIPEATSDNLQAALAVDKAKPDAIDTSALAQLTPAATAESDLPTL